MCPKCHKLCVLRNMTDLSIQLLSMYLEALIQLILIARKNLLSALVKISQNQNLLPQPN